MAEWLCIEWKECKISTYLPTYLPTYEFDLKKIGWRGPGLPEWLGIEGKGCKILSRLSLSEGSQLEVSSAHWNHHSCAVQCTVLQTFGSVSSVQSDRLSNIVRAGLAKPQWYHCQQRAWTPNSAALQIRPVVLQCTCNTCDFDSWAENRLTLHRRIFHISPIRGRKGFWFLLEKTFQKLFSYGEHFVYSFINHNLYLMHLCL